MVQWFTVQCYSYLVGYRHCDTRVAEVRHVIDGSRDLCRRDGRGRRDTLPTFEVELPRDT